MVIPHFIALDIEGLRYPIVERERVLPGARVKAVERSFGYDTTMRCCLEAEAYQTLRGHRVV